MSPIDMELEMKLNQKQNEKDEVDNLFRMVILKKLSDIVSSLQSIDKKLVNNNNDKTTMERYDWSKQPRQL